jgi:adenylate cyclase
LRSVSAVKLGPARTPYARPTMTNPPLQLSSIDVIASALAPSIPAMGDFSSPDGSVTLMLGEIENASAAAQELGPEAWDQLLRDHRVLVDQLVAHHDGQVVKYEADGFLASFNSAHAGLHGAVELQRTFTGPAGPGARPLSVRLGLHSGFVISESDQLLGRNVVLAARIATHAKGGEILVSSSLKQYTEHDPSFTFEPRGEFHFKGLLGEHELFAVAWR